MGMDVISGFDLMFRDSGKYDPFLIFQDAVFPT